MRLLHKDAYCVAILLSRIQLGGCIIPPNRTAAETEQTESGTDDAEREQRLLADFAEPRGGKACVAGLKRKAENGERTTAEGI